MPAGAAALRRARRLGAVIGMSPRSINERIVSSSRSRPTRHPRPRRRAADDAQLPARAPRPVPRRDGRSQVYLRRYRRARLPPSCSATSARSTPSELKERATAASTRGRRRQGRHRVRLRQLPARRAGRAEHRGRRRGPAREPARSRATARAGDQLRLRSTCPSSRRGREARCARVHAGGEPGTAGAFVAIDPRNGQILRDGLATRRFKPSILAKPISQQRYDSLFGRAGRLAAVQPRDRGGYPTGSTFKPITALAALEAGLITPGHADQRSGLPQDRPAQTFHNAGDAVNGTIGLRRALQVSSDVFFYTLGRDANGLKGQVDPELGARARPRPPHGHRPARRDPGHDARPRLARTREQAPRRPASASARSSLRDLRQAPVVASATTSTSPSARATCRPTPLQMAVAYSAHRTNGGKVVRPHLGVAVEDDGGGELQRIECPPRAPRARSTRRPPGGDRRPAHGDDGRAARPPTCSATGTRPLPGLRQDRHRGAPSATATSPGTCAYVRDRTRPIVIAVTVEEGGFGAEAAAPIACRMLASGSPPEGVAAGSGDDRATMSAQGADPAARARGRRAPAALLLPLRPAAGAGGRSASRLLARRRSRAATRGRRARATRTTSSTARRSTSSSAASLLAALRGSTTRVCASSSTCIYGLLIALDPRGAALGARRARLAARDRPAVLLLPGIRARQGAARSSRWRLRRSTARGALRDRETTAA